MKRQGGARCLGGGEGLWGRGCQLRRGQQIGPPGKQQLMHPRGRGGVSAGRMGQGGHLPGRPQGIWPVGSWDVTTTCLGSGLRCPLVALRGARPEPVQVSTSPRLRAPPRTSALPPISSSVPCAFGGASRPLWALPLHPPARGSRAPRARPHRREREAVPRPPRRPPEGQGEPVLVLGGQPARQRPVGGAQSGVPPETEQDAPSASARAPGSASPKPWGTRREGAGLRPRERGRRGGASQTGRGVAELRPL